MYGSTYLSTTYLQYMGTVNNRRFYLRVYGTIFEVFESRESEGEQGYNNAYMINPPSPPCQRPAPHYAATAVGMSAPPPRDKPQNLKYPGQMWIWPHPSHMVCAAQELQPDTSDREKIPYEVYCHNCLMYNIVCYQVLVTTDGGYQGGMALIMRERPEGCIIKSKRFHGPDVVSCKIVSGSQRTLLIGVHLLPYTIDHLPDLEEAIN